MRSTALAALALVALSSPLAAAPADQFEWAQDYEGARTTLSTARGMAPILSPEALSSTREAAERLRTVVAAGGWTPVLGAEALGLGSSGAAVVALRRRLSEGGDLDASKVGTPVYDSYVKAAVQRFQSRHGLGATGAMNPATARAMNVPAAARLRQLEANALRLASYQVDLGRRHVVVNLAGALMQAVEDGRVHSQHAAGVGKVDRQSPVMNAKATEINFNPTWTAPASIVRKDLIPKMRKDPGYLARNRIRVFDGERELRPEQVDWSGDEATRYRFRQDPGADVNAMGFVRINIPNPHGVYMHDTPDRGIYRDDWRFISSGCVRVQDVRGYVAWLLRETPGWDDARISEVVASGARVDAPLAQPVPVYWVYVTAWATPDGTVQFRDDIYGKDPADAAGPAVAAVPPGPAAASPYGRIEAVPEPIREAAAADPEDGAGEAGADGSGDAPVPPAPVGPVR